MIKTILLSFVCAASLSLPVKTYASAMASPDSSKTAIVPPVRKDTVNIWIPTMVTGLNLSQIAFSNWTQGGSNSLAWTANANLGYDYKGTTWGLVNHLQASYGRTKLGGQNSILTDNNLMLTNVLTYDIGWPTNPFFSNTIITAITTGYSYSQTPAIAVADFFDPGYVTQSLGLSYSELKNFSTRLGIAAQEVFANRFRTFVKSPTIPNTVQGGIQSVSQGEFTIADNILVTSGLTLFSRFNSLDVWDVRWDNLIVAKVNSFINVNFTYDLVYMKDQSLRTQMKEGLQVGIVYTMF